MADSSLDDFFAKKDKSKKKSKSSKVTTGDILAKADDEAKKKEKKKKAKETSQSASKDTNVADKGPDVGEEDEWKEVEEEKEVDYSGLRIGNLQVGEKEGEESEDQATENADEDDEEGEGKEKREGQQGPWKAASQSTVTPTEVVPEEPPKPKEEPKTPGKYIPPGQRAAAAAAASSGASPSPTVPSHLRKKKVAPNLRSEEDFPTLGGGPGRPQPDSDPRSFERVQHGGRQMEDPNKATQQLSLGNKFSALQD